MSGPGPIADLAEFLAHALALERESVERYEELAASMELHHNHAIAGLFRKLAGFGRLHAEQVSRLAAGMDLPPLRPWEFRWSDDEAPETGGYEDVHYLLTPLEALRFALRNEEAGRDFYARVASESPDAGVRRVAAEFADEEAGHAAILQRWIGNTAQQPPGFDVDLDEPHQPD